MFYCENSKIWIGIQSKITKKLQPPLYGGRYWAIIYRILAWSMPEFMLDENS